MEIYDYDHAPSQLRNTFGDFDYIVICKDAYDCFTDFFVGISEYSESIRYKITEEGIKEYVGVLGNCNSNVMNVYDDWVQASNKKCKDYLGYEIILFNIVPQPNILFMDGEHGGNEE